MFLFLKHNYPIVPASECQSSLLCKPPEAPMVEAISKTHIMLTKGKKNMTRMFQPFVHYREKKTLHAQYIHYLFFAHFLAVTTQRNNDVLHLASVFYHALINSALIIIHNIKINMNE